MALQAHGVTLDAGQYNIIGTCAVLAAISAAAIPSAGLVTMVMVMQVSFSAIAHMPHMHCCLCFTWQHLKDIAFPYCAFLDRSYPVCWAGHHGHAGQLSAIAHVPYMHSCLCCEWQHLQKLLFCSACFLAPAFHLLGWLPRSLSCKTAFSHCMLATYVLVPVSCKSQSMGHIVDSSRCVH